MREYWNICCMFPDNAMWTGFSTSRTNEVSAIRDALDCKRAGGRDIRIVKITEEDITHKTENL